MLESELNKEREALRDEIEGLRQQAEQLKGKESRLSHVEALLGIGDRGPERVVQAVAGGTRENCCDVVCVVVGADGILDSNAAQGASINAGS